jgi:hypothetical protein
MENRVNVATADAALGGKGFVMHVTKRTARQEYRLKQRERIEASPFMAEKFPGLKSLKVTLEYYHGPQPTKNGEMTCKLNVEHARSVLWFACPATECAEGDFDLSEALASAVAARRKVATGELRCQGRRKRGDRQQVPCHTLLRFTFNLNYD